MRLLHGSIRKKLIVLILLATAPVMLPLLAVELSNRQQKVILAEKDTAIFLNGFVEVQRRITASTETLLRTVSNISEIKNMETEPSCTVLRVLLESNPIYTNAFLLDLQGNVVASGKNYEQAKLLNFSDRKQFREAISSQGFASGEFVVGKLSQKAIFPFGRAVLDARGNPQGVIIIGVNLYYYSSLFQKNGYSHSSFFGLSDYKGRRLFRYPSTDDTPAGYPIKKEVFEAASLGKPNGSIKTLASDGRERIIVFKRLTLRDSHEPYMYMFLGFDHKRILQEADSILTRLIIIGFLSLGLALGIAWFVGSRSIAQRIEALSIKTERFAHGEKNLASNMDYSDGEIGLLAKSFDNMVALIQEQEKQRDASEAEKEKLFKQLTQVQKMDAIGQLAGGIAHDFNNMLGGILGASEVLALNLPEDSKSKKFLALIVQSANRAAELTNKLLTFSRDTSKVSTALSVHALINEMLTLLENTIDRRITVETQFEAEFDTVLGDPSQLQNVFLNLAINSSHAMPDGGTILILSKNTELDATYCKITPFNLQPGHFLELEIQDSGCGIPLEYLSKIFEPFYTTKEQGKGTGLGLAVAYGTIKNHGGAISVYSEVNVGTTFHILLPVADSDCVVKKNPPLVQKGEGIILIVDDEEIMRITAKVLLEELGYEVITAENGQHALEIYKTTEHIDLVILDMIMPVMNGRDCFMALRQYDPDVRILLSSGFTRKEDLEEMELHGLVDFIRKPYRTSTLSYAIYKALL